MRIGSHKLMQISSGDQDYIRRQPRAIVPRRREEKCLFLAFISRRVNDGVTGFDLDDCSFAAFPVDEYKLVVCGGGGAGAWQNVPAYKLEIDEH